MPSEVWQKELDWRDCLPEFPFITTCLVLGAGADLEKGYVSNVMPEPWNLEFNGGDNNDGITAIDITALMHIRYCFVYWDLATGASDDEDNGNDEHASELAQKPDLNMVPLTGEDYLGIYYKPADVSTDMQDTIERLRKHPLVDSKSLEQTWPKGSWRTREENRLDNVDSIIYETSNLSLKTGPQLGSLAEIAMEGTIKRLLNDDDDLQDEVEMLPAFLPSLRQYLQWHPEVVSSCRYGYDMLKRALKDSPYLDLHSYPDLSEEQILGLVRDAAPQILYLDVSGNRNITAEQVILHYVPKPVCSDCILGFGSSEPGYQVSLT